VLKPDVFRIGNCSAFLMNFSTGFKIRRRISKLHPKLVIEISAAQPDIGQKGSMPCARQYSVMRKDTMVEIAANPAKTMGIMT